MRSYLMGLGLLAVGALSLVRADEPAPSENVDVQKKSADTTTSDNETKSDDSSSKKESH